MRAANSLAVLLLPVFFWLTPAAAEEPCKPVSFDSASYIVCTFDARQSRIELFDLDERGLPYASFSALAAELMAKGKQLVFGMNAGMFDEKLRPIGYYVEDGRQVKKVNRRNGQGNFHLKPNGIFYVQGDKVGVVETETYLKSGPNPEFATQSGPMLVINGEIHPAFSPDGTSRKRRNGVGVRDENTAVFVISEDEVNFHSFARLFRDQLKCRNALFLDGTISSLFDPAQQRNDSVFPLGPIVAVIK
jgi:uncharacterized protein YigE (DUF2233 family)